jgi:hypothetical protein
MIFKFPVLFGKKVAVVGDFNNWHPYVHLLKKKNQQWSIDLNLAKGTYYYKFLIDDQLWINDPQADFYFNDGKGALNSVIKVNKDNSLTPNNDYGVITDICLNNSFNKQVLMKKVKTIDQNTFNISSGQVFVYHSIKDFVGEVELSYVWCTPDLRVYDCESTLITGTEGEQRLYSSISLKGEDIRPGLWKLFILLNGSLIVKKEFRLKANFYYHSKGKVLVR